MVDHSLSLGRVRDFRLLWIGGLFAGLGAQLSTIAMPLLILRQTGSAVLAGAVGTVSVTALLVSMLPGGAVADSIERRRLMLWCDIVGTTAVVLLATAVLTGGAPFALIVLVAVTSAAIGTVYGPSALGLLRAVVPDRHLHTASARLQARNAAARLIGPTVGGVLFTVHPASPFVVQAACLLLSTLCVAAMRTRSLPAPQPGSVFAPRELGAGVRFLWSDRYLRTVLLVFGLGVNACFSAASFVAIVASSPDGTSGVGAGTIASLTAVGGLLGALAAPRLSPTRRPGPLIAASCWVVTAGVGLMTVNQHPVYLGLLCAVCIASASVSSIGFVSSLLAATPGHLVGRVHSAASFLSSLVTPVGPLLGGTLVTLHGASSSFAGLAVVFAVCAVVVSLSPAVRHRTGTPAAVSGPGPNAAPARDVERNAS